MLKKTKIIATIGPSSSSPSVIAELISKGVDIFRLNFSHGTHQILLQAIKDIRQQQTFLNKEIGILADLQGPKIRTGRTIDDKPVTIQKGAIVRLTSEKIISSADTISIDYPGLAKEVDTGQLIMINDGAIRLKVDRISNIGELFCTVISGGSYSSRKGVNLPDVDLATPSLTEKDRADLDFILEQDVQFIALSFVRKAADLEELKSIVSSRKKDIKIIAKIEKPEAARKADEILAACDGIMVARGDLGVETDPSVVPILQKKLIESADKAGKVVIVATQMLESMINNPLPTRAEASDVANAILDRTDAIMLSGETAVGAYPVRAVEMMVEIAQKAESSDYMPRDLVDLSRIGIHPPRAICDAAILASRDMGKIPICIFTISGDTALYISKKRSLSPLFVFCPDPQVVKILSLGWNLNPFYLPFSTEISSLISGAEQLLLEKGHVKKGNLIVLVSGTTPVKGETNSLRIKRVGDEYR
jgi:pyruvate kinase